MKRDAENGAKEVAAAVVAPRRDFPRADFPGVAASSRSLALSQARIRGAWKPGSQAGASVQERVSPTRSHPKSNDAVEMGRAIERQRLLLHISLGL
jgi:hypothetical protein